MPNKLLTLRALLLFCVLLPFSIAFKNIYSGSFPFWYDIGRDLMLASQNLEKLTLIGPTSGIPGIFYGPYWIWILSIPQLFSKDPRVINFFVSAVPYFLIFPVLLFGFRRIFGATNVVLLWLLFAFSYGITYGSQMWNPFLAPVLFLALAYFLVFNEYSNKRKNLFFSSLCGLLLGMILNFHISFGIGVAFGVAIFLGTTLFLKRTSKESLLNFVLNVAALGTGLILSLVPFFTFELRHGFNQTRVFISTFSKYGDVVGVNGLSSGDIIRSFLGRFGGLFHIDHPYFVSFLLFAGLALLSLFVKKGMKFSEIEKKLLIFLVSVFIGIIGIYLTAKNPIWAYHFIGVEVLFLLLIGLLVKRSKIIQQLLGLGVLIIVLFNTMNFIKTSKMETKEPSALINEQRVVEIIVSDANGREFSFFSDNPSIYLYEYAYLFNWKTNREYSYDPSQMPKKDLVYLILSKNTSESERENLLNYRSLNFETTKSWQLNDNTVILRREKL